MNKSYLNLLVKLYLDSLAGGEHGRPYVEGFAAFILENIPHYSGGTVEGGVKCVKYSKTWKI